jgi:two-component system, NarL family, sensor histidine kinase EvgS
MYKFLLLFFFLYNLLFSNTINQNINNNFTIEEQEFINNHKTLILANENDWIPLDYNENNEAKGYAIDYIKLIFSKIGIEPIFVNDSWGNLISKFKNNEIDVFPILGYSKKREEIFNFTNSFYTQEFSIITKINKFDFINIDDLSGKKVAMARNWNTTKLLKENYKKINIVEFDTLDEIFESIKNNECDATIQSSLVANYFINLNYSDSLKILTKVNINNVDNKLYIGVKKEFPILVDIINKAINKVSLSEVDALNNKWLNDKKNISFSQKEIDFIENKVVNIAFTDNWAPINFVEKNKAYGLGYDFWEYIADKANLKTNIITKKSFSDALESIKNKSSDIIVATSSTIDREKYALFSDIYYKAPIGIATLQDKNYIPDPSYLLGKKIGVGKNYTAYKILQKEYPTMEFVFVNNIEEGLSLLSNNEICPY